MWKVLRTLLSLGVVTVSQVGCATIERSALPEPKVLEALQQRSNHSALPLGHYVSDRAVRLGAIVEIPASGNECDTYTYLWIELQKDGEQFKNKANIPTVAALPCRSQGCTKVFDPQLIENLESDTVYKWQVRPITEFFHRPNIGLCESREKHNGPWDGNLGTHFFKTEPVWSQAISRPLTARPAIGRQIGGDVNDVLLDDDSFYVIRADPGTAPRVMLETKFGIDQTPKSKRFGRFSFGARAKSTPSCGIYGWVWNPVAKGWTQMQDYKASPNEQAFTFALPDDSVHWLSNYLEPDAGLPANFRSLKFALGCDNQAGGPFELSIDQVELTFQVIN